MIMVLPVSDIDLGKAEKLAKWVTKLGEMREVRVLVAATRNASWDIEPVLAQLRSGFGEVNYFTLPTENEEGWPGSANHLFYSVVEHLVMIKNEEPWYFFEADNMPLVPGWWAKIKAEYETAGKPYMGVINKTQYLNKITGEKITRGKHMVGTGVYPGDFAFLCRSVHYMDTRPFDICIEEEVVPECHDTKLIAHRWGTVNYRRESGLIMMDDREPGFDYAAPIPPEAVVVHGCKDDSLLKLLDPSLLIA